MDKVLPDNPQDVEALINRAAEQAQERVNQFARDRAPDRLPNTLHELVALAIADSQSLDWDEYKPTSSEWHSPGTYWNCDVCFVCFAGSIMAGTLNTPRDKDIENLCTDLNISASDAIKLRALNEIRTGQYLKAYTMLHGSVSDKQLTREQADGLTFLTNLETSEYADFSDWDDYDEFLYDIEHRVLPVLLDLGI